MRNVRHTAACMSYEGDQVGIRMKSIVIVLTSFLLLSVLGCQGEFVQEREFTAIPSDAAIVEPGDTALEGQTSEDVAIVVLRATAELICPHLDAPGELEFATTGYGFHCATAAGHGTNVRLEEFGSEAEAQAAFNAGREENSVEEFHGFPLSVRGEDNPSLPGGREEYRIWHWTAGRWVVEIRAFDDTPYLVAPNPEGVSEVLYQMGIEHGLFVEANG